MLIGYRGKVAGRVHRVADTDYQFNRQDPKNPHAPLVCEVKDDAALAVFLSEANRNLFYAIDPGPANLSRGNTEAEAKAKAEAEAALAAEKAAAAEAEAKAGEPKGTDLSAAAATVLADNAPGVIKAVSSITDAAMLAALEAAEKADKNRTGVLQAINAAKAALA